MAASATTTAFGAASASASASASAATAAPMHEPWVEKYRPSTLSEVKGQREIVEQFQRTLERNQAMHFTHIGNVIKT